MGVDTCPFYLGIIYIPNRTSALQCSVVTKLIDFEGLLEMALQGKNEPQYVLGLRRGETHPKSVKKQGILEAQTQAAEGKKIKARDVAPQIWI